MYELMEILSWNFPIFRAINIRKTLILLTSNIRIQEDFPQKETKIGFIICYMINVSLH